MATSKARLYAGLCALLALSTVYIIVRSSNTFSLSSTARPLGAVKGLNSLLSNASQQASHIVRQLGTSGNQQAASQGHVVRQLNTLLVNASQQASHIVRQLGTSGNQQAASQGHVVRQLNTLLVNASLHASSVVNQLNSSKLKEGVKVVLDSVNQRLQVQPEKKQGRLVTLLMTSAPRPVTQAYVKPRQWNNAHPKAVNVDGFNYLLTPDVCEGQQPRYLAYVHSAPTYFDKRQNLRDSWARVSYYPPGFFRVMFVVGRTRGESATLRAALRSEWEKHHDLLYCNYTDSYTNLTYKAVLSMRYIVSRCKDVQYIIKSDDDAVINVPAVHAVLGKAPPSSLTVNCILFANNMPIIRDGQGPLKKWYVSYEEYPKRNPDFYPTYCSGTGLAMTSGMLREIYEQVPLRPWLWVDDAYFTGVLTEHINKKINWKDVPNAWGYDKALEELKKSSQPHTFMFMIQMFGRTQMLTMWNNLLEKDTAAGILIQS